MHGLCMYWLVATLLLSLLIGGDAWCEASEQRIGVLARGGDRIAPDRFATTAEYLTRQIPGRTFSFVPLTRVAMNDAVARGELAFAITNPGHSVHLEVMYGATPIATAQDSWQGTLYSTIGAVVIVQARRPDLARMADLKGKSFMADSRNSFDGFQIAWWELKAHGVDPFRDFSRLVFSDSRRKASSKPCATEVSMRRLWNPACWSEWPMQAGSISTSSAFCIRTPRRGTRSPGAANSIPSGRFSKRAKRPTNSGNA